MRSQQHLSPVINIFIFLSNDCTLVSTKAIGSNNLPSSINIIIEHSLDNENLNKNPQSHLILLTGGCSHIFLISHNISLLNHLYFVLQMNQHIIRNIA